MLIFDDFSKEYSVSLVHKCFKLHRNKPHSRNRTLKLIEKQGCVTDDDNIQNCFERRFSNDSNARG